MRFYIVDGDGRVVGKFDGDAREAKPGHERLEVDSVEELSEVDVDVWDTDYQT